jgi:hypothetical protein
MKVERTWLRTFVLIVVTPAIIAELAVVALNIYVDPLWTIPIVQRPLAYCVRNERVNKVNLIVRSTHKWDAVVLGNSRAAFFDPHFFKNADVFNLAVSGMRNSEYIDYLKIFMRHVGKPKIAYVAFDFISRSRGVDITANENASRVAREIETASTRPLYALETTLDWATAFYSLDVLANCNASNYGRPLYWYGGAEFINRQTYDIQHDQMIDNQAEDLVHSSMLDTTFRADTLLPAQIEALNNILPGSEIIAFIPPITERLFLAEMAAGRFDDYLDWLGTLVNKFGAVRYFAGINAFTEDIANFYDGHHVYSDLTSQIVDILEGRAPPRPDGFGRLITVKDFPAFAKSLRDDVCRLVRPRFETPSFVRGCPAVQPLRFPQTEIYAFNPFSDNWTVALKTTSVRRQNGALVINSAPGMSEYQIMSPAIPVHLGMIYQVEADVSVSTGRLSLGVLDVENDRWIALRAVDVSQSWMFRATSSKVQLILALNNETPAATIAAARKMRLLGY